MTDWPGAPDQAEVETYDAVAADRAAAASAAAS
jgi:hypothetical protein